MTRYSIRMAATTLALLIVATMAPVHAQGQPARAAVAAAVGRVIAAANRVDLEGVLAEFASNAETLDGTHVVTDKNAARALYVPIFKGLRSQDIRVERSSTQLLTPTAALYTASGHFTATDTAGVTGPRLSFAWTILWQVQNGAWKATNMQQSLGDAGLMDIAQAGTSNKADIVYMSADRASYVEAAGGPVMTAAIVGDAERDAPHSEFAKFPPAFDAGTHTHTNTVTLVVIKGAYLYRDENGEKRVGPGEVLRIPGGHKHWSGGDAKEGAVFYMHMDRRMDQIPAK